MKSATTSLCSMLSQHPDVFVPRIKEPDFYSRDELFSKGLDWYKTFFVEGQASKVVIDGSTTYTKELQFPQAAKRIGKYHPESKILYILRHPIERLKSHWSHELLKNRTTLGLDDFVLNHPEAIDVSRYWKQISCYRDYFSDEQILVLFTQDFFESPIPVLRKCCQFLQLAEFEFETSDQIENKSSNRQFDTFPIRYFRKYRWFDTKFEKLKQAIPASWHSSLKLLFKNGKGAPDQQLSESTRKWAEERIIDDASSLLKKYNRPEEFWQFQIANAGLN